MLSKLVFHIANSKAKSCDTNVVRLQTGFLNGVHSIYKWNRCQGDMQKFLHSVVYLHSLNIQSISISNMLKSISEKNGATSRKDENNNLDPQMHPFV